MLEENECLWSVTFTSRDDGHRCTAAVFSNQSTADRFCREKSYGDNQKVVQTRLWKDTESGKYYEITKREVKVDGPLHRAQALAKLTPQEREALGIE